MRDQDLIRRTLEARPGAFDQLYYAYVDRVHRHLYTLVGPDPDLEDLVQLTFVQVHRKLHTYRFEASFPTWLHRVAINTALAHLRRRRPRVELTDELVHGALESLQGPLESPEEAIDRKRRAAMLHAVIDRLDPKKRVVYVLYELEGRTLEEIGELLETSINTVAARLRVARAEVRKTLERRFAARERGLGATA